MYIQLIRQVNHVGSKHIRKPAQKHKDSTGEPPNFGGKQVGTVVEEQTEYHVVDHSNETREDETRSSQGLSLQKIGQEEEDHSNQRQEEEPENVQQSPFDEVRGEQNQAHAEDAAEGIYDHDEVYVLKTHFLRILKHDTVIQIQRHHQEACSDESEQVNSLEQNGDLMTSVNPKVHVGVMQLQELELSVLQSVVQFV